MFLPDFSAGSSCSPYVAYFPPPGGSCFEAAGPQGFVKYLTKYVVILGIDDLEEIFLFLREDKLNREDILLFSWRINLSDVEDILLFL